jgi:hypothetical protein
MAKSTPEERAKHKTYMRDWRAALKKNKEVEPWIARRTEARAAARAAKDAIINAEIDAKNLLIERNNNLLVKRILAAAQPLPDRPLSKREYKLHSAGKKFIPDEELRRRRRLRRELHGPFKRKARRVRNKAGQLVARIPKKSPSATSKKPKIAQPEQEQEEQKQEQSVSKKPAKPVSKKPAKPVSKSPEQEEKKPAGPAFVWTEPIWPNGFGAVSTDPEAIREREAERAREREIEDRLDRMTGCQAWISLVYH